MTTLDALLAGIVADPREETRWLVLADWLEEHDEPGQAELLRLHRQLLASCCEPDAHPNRAAWQSRIVELMKAGVQPCVPQETVQFRENVAMRFSFIPPGSFLRVNPTRTLNRPPKTPHHLITITRGFYLGVHPVTQQQWQAVAGSDLKHYFEGPDRPAECVSWTDAVEDFCARATKYFLTGRGEIRLPTEAEWELACRAGTTTEYYTGADDAALDLAGWFAENSGRKTHPAGQKLANAWGLHDMHGNVSEWCSDWYKHIFFSKQQVDPAGHATGTAKVHRGGSWYPGRCTSSARNGHGRTVRRNNIGFRVVLDLREK